MARDIIAKTFEQLYGQPCWGLGHDKWFNLWMNFGKPSLNIREPFKPKSKSKAVAGMARRRGITVRGQWWLNVFCCYWKISLSEQRLATGCSSRRQINKAFLELEGQKLVKVNVNRATGATQFVFDLGGVLDCRRFEKKSDDPLWILHKPNGYVLTVYGNGLFSHGPGSQVPSEKVLRPIGKPARLQA